MTKKKAKSKPPKVEAKPSVEVKSEAVRSVPNGHAIGGAMSDYTRKPKRWLWENKFLNDGISMIAGVEGHGKGFLTMLLMRHITNGIDWPDGAPCEEGCIVYLKSEESLDNLQERCEANGINQNHLFYIEEVKDKNGDAVPVTMQHVSDIRQFIEDREAETGLPVKALFIDPISELNGTANLNMVTDVRDLLRPYRLLAEEKGIAVIIVNHLTKSGRGPLRKQIQGSGAFSQTCRSVWAVVHDREEDIRYCAPTKNNCCKNPTAFTYVIEEGGRAQWREMDLTVDIDAIAAEQNKVDRSQTRKTKTVSAEEWLLDFLRDGEKPAKDVLEAAVRMGYKKRTIERAKESASIETTKHGFGKGSYSVWARKGHTPPRMIDAVFSHSKVAETIEANSFTSNSPCSPK